MSDYLYKSKSELHDMLHCFSYTYYNKAYRAPYFKIYQMGTLSPNLRNKDFSTTVLGEKIAIPFGIGPINECKGYSGGVGISFALARGAQHAGTIYTFPVTSRYSIEELAATAPHGIKWIQIFLYHDRRTTYNVIKRAEKAGYKAIVIPIYSPVDKPTYLRHHLYNHRVTRADLQWLQSITRLPLILKGAFTPQEAIQTASYGIRAIWLSSNGMQPTGPFAIECLGAISKALLGTRVEIYVDGGVTTGNDILRAISLGATMVFMATLPFLCVGKGEAGVKQMFDVIKKDLALAMESNKCNAVDNIKKRCFPVYSKL